MSEYLKCPLCGAPLDLEQETDSTANHSCRACDYTGPSVYKYSRRDVVAIQEEQNALIAAALERARQPVLHATQTPDTGLGAVICKWPGAETDACVAEYFDCDTPTIRDAEGRVVHRAGNDRTYMPGDDAPEM